MLRGLGLDRRAERDTGNSTRCSERGVVCPSVLLVQDSPFRTVMSRNLPRPACNTDLLLRSCFPKNWVIRNGVPG